MRSLQAFALGTFSLIVDPTSFFFMEIHGVDELPNQPLSDCEPQLNRVDPFKTLYSSLDRLTMGLPFFQAQKPIFVDLPSSGSMPTFQFWLRGKKRHQFSGADECALRKGMAFP